MIGDCTLPAALPPQWADMADDASLQVSTLRKAISAEADLALRLKGLQVADLSRPYGRHVLLEGGSLEIMLATWTRGLSCAPHDHGGSQGVVRVLSGRARHRIYRLQAGRLVVVKEEIARAGDLLICGRDLVHDMGDDGADLPLVTLHMYSDPVPHMVVYDLAAGRTLKVDGGCGAWVPSEDSEQILQSRHGMVPSHEMV